MALIPKTEEQHEFYNQLSKKAINKQTFIDFFENNQTASWKQDTLLFLAIMTENFSLFDTQSRKGSLKKLYNEDILFETHYKYSKNKQVKFDTECLKKCLEKVDSGDYLNFTLGSFSAGHALLIYKAADNKYLFFDPNVGSIGFDKEGNPSLTLEQLAEVMSVAVNDYAELIRNTMSKFDQIMNSKVHVHCSNITKNLDKSIEFHKKDNHSNTFLDNLIGLYKKFDKDNPDSKLVGMKIENLISDEITTRL